MTKLTYRGISYEPSTIIFMSQRTNITAVYRGQSYQTNHPCKIDFRFLNRSKRRKNKCNHVRKNSASYPYPSSSSPSVVHLISQNAYSAQ